MALLLDDDDDRPTRIEGPRDAVLVLVGAAIAKALADHRVDRLDADLTAHRALAWLDQQLADAGFVVRQLVERPLGRQAREHAARLLLNEAERLSATSNLYAEPDWTRGSSYRAAAAWLLAERR